MANYSNGNNNATTPALAACTTTYNTLLTVRSTTGALRRGKLYDFMFGTLGTPADNVMQFDISRITADGTAGSVSTPNPLDPADVACLSTSALNYPNGTPPTYTANSSVFFLGINQRASYRWVAAPGSELVWPSTANAGLGIRALSPAYTGTVSADILFQEQ